MPRVSEATKALHRERLLAAAAAEFASKGLDGARVDDISIEAGLAKGTIYNYFASKDDVFSEVVSAWFARVANERRQLPEDAPVREQLLSIVEAEVTVTAEMEQFARTAFREMLRADPSVSLLPDPDPIDAAILAAVDRGQRRGELRSDRSAAELARMFATLVVGLLVEHWMPASTIRLDDIPTLAVDYYLEGATVR